MKTKRILVGVCGNVGVGKTTSANLIAASLRGQHLDVDHFKKMHADPQKVTEEIDGENVRRIYYLAALEHAMGMFTRGEQVVVMEEIFHLHCLRQEIEEYMHLRGVTVVWIHVRVSDFSVVQRRLQNSARRGHILTTSQALHLYNLFEKAFDPFPSCTGNVFLLYNDDEYRDHPPIEGACAFIRERME